MTQLQTTNKLSDIDTFRWRCMDGRLMRLSEMETSHIFNAMKMIFNHIAEAQGGDSVWFVNRYSDYASNSRSQPHRLAAQVVFFIQEIERRDDLPTKYNVPYQQILNQVRGVLSLQGVANNVTRSETHPSSSPRALSTPEANPVD